MMEKILELYTVLIPPEKLLIDIHCHTDTAIVLVLPPAASL